jgi:hypothetical protein
MRVTQFSLLAAASQVAWAYLDTSPFFLFSTSEYARTPDDEAPRPNYRV